MRQPPAPCSCHWRACTCGVLPRPSEPPARPLAPAPGCAPPPDASRAVHTARGGQGEGASSRGIGGRHAARRPSGATPPPPHPAPVHPRASVPLCVCVLQAGQDVTVYYNPNNTNLNGRHAVFLKVCGAGLGCCGWHGVTSEGGSSCSGVHSTSRAVPGAHGCSMPGAHHPSPTLPTLPSTPATQGGYNRWRHPRGFGPLEMTPPTEGEHFQVGGGCRRTVRTVPHAAARA